MLLEAVVLRYLSLYRRLVHVVHTRKDLPLDG